MVLKFINATEAKPGTNILLEKQPYTVKKVDISKTGKHGSSKCRIEAMGILNETKKVFVVPGHERFEVPMITKNKAQVLSIGSKISIMDLENYENFEIECPEEIKNGLKENDNVEYWNIEGEKIIKRKL